MITWPSINVKTLSGNHNLDLFDILCDVRVTAVDGSTLAPNVDGAKAILSHATGDLADFPLAVDAAHFVVA